VFRIAKNALAVFVADADISVADTNTRNITLHSDVIPFL
jgi:hypothetical protein